MHILFMFNLINLLMHILRTSADYDEGACMGTSHMPKSTFPHCLTDLINMHPHPHSLVQPSCVLEGHIKLDVK